MIVKLIRKVKWISLIVIFAQCESPSPVKTCFGLLFNNQWDSLGTCFEDPNEELTLIRKSGLELTNDYGIDVRDSILIVNINEDACDTIIYTWSAASGRVVLDSFDLPKILAREVVIRNLMVTNYIEKGNAERAWLWLTYPNLLGTDSLVGNFFYKLGYSRDLETLGSYIPIIERAWQKGHENSGMVLSTWLTFIGKRDQAIKLLKKLADGRNTEAMVKLGDIYDTYLIGYNPPADARPESAFEWYMKAAWLDNSMAMYRLGRIYEIGMNRKVDIDSAIFWYRRASEGGESSGSLALATLYFGGVNVRESIDSGNYWMKKATQQDPQLAYMELGELYEQGYIFERDEGLAIHYYLKADSAGSPVAKYALERLGYHQ